MEIVAITSVSLSLADFLRGVAIGRMKGRIKSNTNYSASCSSTVVSIDLVLFSCPHTLSNFRELSGEYCCYQCTSVFNNLVMQ